MTAVAERAVSQEAVSDYVRGLTLLLFKAVKQIKPDDPTIDPLISVFKSEEPITEIKYLNDSSKDICIIHPGERATIVKSDGTVLRSSLHEYSH